MITSMNQYEASSSYRVSRVSEEKGDQWHQALALLDDVCLDTWRKNLVIGDDMAISPSCGTSSIKHTKHGDFWWVNDGWLIMKWGLEGCTTWNIDVLFGDHMYSYVIIIAHNMDAHQNQPDPRSLYGM
jgi:hypothetical protein